MGILLLLAVLTQDISFTNPPTTTVWESGPSNQKFDITFIGDGYTESQQDKFNNDVQRVVDHLTTCLEPWTSWRNAINFHRVNVVSIDSGVGGNTALQTSWRGTSAIWPDNWDNVEFASSLVQTDSLVILVNIPDRVGAAILDSVAVSGTGLQLVDVISHELGHSVGKCHEEYGGDSVWLSDIEPPFPNMTINLNTLKWSEFVGQEGVGAFEGGGTVNYGVWRPTYNNCMMRELMNHYCPVCRNAIVTEIRKFALNSVATDEPIAAKCHYHGEVTNKSRGMCMASLQPPDTGIDTVMFIFLIAVTILVLFGLIIGRSNGTSSHRKTGRVSNKKTGSR